MHCALRHSRVQLSYGAPDLPSLALTMLANSFRQLSRASAGRPLVNQSTTSFANLAPFATAAQPSDPKTVLAILYKAGDASKEKRLLGTDAGV